MRHIPKSPTYANDLPRVFIYSRFEDCLRRLCPYALGLLLITPLPLCCLCCLYTYMGPRITAAGVTVVVPSG